MDRHYSGRRELRMLRRRLNLLLLAAAFCAWATDGEEKEERLDYRQRRWRWSVREGPSRALLIDACDAVAHVGSRVFEAAVEFAQPLQDIR
eukprot:1640707-Pyramimonas_sp.AAC.1